MKSPTYIVYISRVNTKQETNLNEIVGQHFVLLFAFSLFVTLFTIYCTRLRNMCPSKRDSIESREQKKYEVQINDPSIILLTLYSIWIFLKIR